MIFNYVMLKRKQQQQTTKLTEVFKSAGGSEMKRNMARIMSIRTHGPQAGHRVGGIVGVSLESLLGRGPKERPKTGHRHGSSRMSVGESLWFLLRDGYWRAG